MCFVSINLAVSFLGRLNSGSFPSDVPVSLAALLFQSRLCGGFWNELPHMTRTCLAKGSPPWHQAFNVSNRSGAISLGLVLMPGLLVTE